MSTTKKKKSIFAKLFGSKNKGDSLDDSDRRSVGDYDDRRSESAYSVHSSKSKSIFSFFSSTKKSKNRNDSRSEGASVYNDDIDETSTNYSDSKSSTSSKKKKKSSKSKRFSKSDVEEEDKEDTASVAASVRSSASRKSSLKQNTAYNTQPPPMPNPTLARNSSMYGGGPMPGSRAGGPNYPAGYGPETVSTYTAGNMEMTLGYGAPRPMIYQPGPAAFTPQGMPYSSDPRYPGYMPTPYGMTGPAGYGQPLGYQDPSGNMYAQPYVDPATGMYMPGVPGAPLTQASTTQSAARGPPSPQTAANNYSMSGTTRQNISQPQSPANSAASHASINNNMNSSTPTQLSQPMQPSQASSSATMSDEAALELAIQESLNASSTQPRWTDEEKRKARQVELANEEALQQAIKASMDTTMAPKNIALDRRRESSIRSDQEAMERALQQSRKDRERRPEITRTLPDASLTRRSIDESVPLSRSSSGRASIDGSLQSSEPRPSLNKQPSLSDTSRSAQLPKTGHDNLSSSSSSSSLSPPKPPTGRSITRLASNIDTSATISGGGIGTLSPASSGYTTSSAISSNTASSSPRSSAHLSLHKSGSGDSLNNKSRPSFSSAPIESPTAGDSASRSRPSFGGTPVESPTAGKVLPRTFTQPKLVSPSGGSKAGSSANSVASGDGQSRKSAR